jgi:putative thiamine transport system permease protein
MMRGEAGRLTPWIVMPVLTVALLAGPVLAGLAGALGPAFGWLPSLGGMGLGLQPWRDLLAMPGLATGVRLSLTTGLGATVLAFIAAVGIIAVIQGTAWAGRLRLLLAPLLAVPHAAFAVGFLFLAAPSGLIARALSPWATGWDRPPDLLTVGDPGGIALLAALAVKETFFLLLVIQAALAQVPADATMRIAATLGYDRRSAWVLLVLPRIYGQIRLPVYAVLAFSCSVIDMALVLGPATPPPLAVQVLGWTQDPDLARRFPAAAGALLQAGIVAGAILLWRAGEGAGRMLLRRLAASGQRRRGAGLVTGAAILAACAVTLTIAAILVLGLWSIAERWRFPDLLPDPGLRAWMQAAPLLAGPLAMTAGIAALSALLALVLVVGCLEHEDRAGVSAGRRALWILYLPLLVPQVTFLFGVQVWLAGIGLSGTAAAVVWMHLLFVLPYTFLTLADPWRSLDPRYSRVALCLGRSPLAVLLAVKLPLLKRPVLTALAVGFAVSVALYLPTVQAGAGRVPTIATEVVSLSAGGDRRLLGAAALVQALLPLLALSAAVLLGRPRFRGQGRT